MDKVINKETQYRIIKKYFDGSSSEEENNMVRKWLSDPDYSIQLENCLKILWKEKGLSNNIPFVDLESLLDKVHHKINLTEKEKFKQLPEYSKSLKSFQNVFRYLARIAAILLLPILIYLSWEVFNQKKLVKSQSDIIYNEIRCPLGARSELKLPDGTKVNLNNGSCLIYPVKFQRDTRVVELHGEAFFDVSHNHKWPFIIKTDGLDVKVLGTRLNVYSYPEEGYQEFTLESGSIELLVEENGQQETILIMKPGQHAVYKFKEATIDQDIFAKKQRSFTNVKSREELKEFVTEMKPDQYVVYEMKDGKVNIGFEKTEKFTSWKEGKLVLRDDPMPFLLKRIERWYNVSFNITDKRINDFTYWATFEEENLDQVLELLSLTGPIKFEKRPRKQLDDGTYKIQEIDVILKEN